MREVLLPGRAVLLPVRAVLLPVKAVLLTDHIVPFGKFLRIGGAPPDTFPNDASEGVGVDRKCFDSPIRK